MAQRFGLLGVFFSILSIATAYGGAIVAPAAVWPRWPLALGTAGVLVSVMVLGAARGGTVGRVKWAFLALFVILAGGFALLFALPAVDPLDPTLWLGLPPRAAIVLYGIGLLPLFVIPVAYAVTFEERTLGEADLERIREAARQRRATRAEPAPAEPVESR